VTFTFLERAFRIQFIPVTTLVNSNFKKSHVFCSFSGEGGHMTFILLAQTLFGNLIAFRILRRFRNRSLISTTSLTKIGTAFAAATALASVFLFSSARFMPLFTVCAAIFLIVMLKVREMRRVSRLENEFPRFLDRWLLNVRTGRAMLPAREQALAACDEQFQLLVRPLFDAKNSVHGAPAHLFLSNYALTELRAVQSESHNTAARLQNLRESLARESDFRRKSGQAMRQAAIQSTVLAFMHVALTGFTAARSGFWANADLMLISTALTLAGMLLLRLLARRIQWSI